MILKNNISIVEHTPATISLPHGSLIIEPKLYGIPLIYDGLKIDLSQRDTLIFFNSGVTFFYCNGKFNSLSCELAFLLSRYMCPQTNVININDDLMRIISKQITLLVPWNIQKELLALQKNHILSKLEKRKYMVNPLIFFNIEEPQNYSKKHLTNRKESRLLRDSMAKHFYDSISKSNKMGKVIARKTVLSIYNDQL